MLYCPKCQATYTDGNQRFCTNEGVRLLPYASRQTQERASKGVFTSILSKSTASKKEGAPVSEPESETQPKKSFEPPPKSKFFKQDDEPDLVIDDEPAFEEPPEEDILETSELFEQLPLARIIDPSLIPEKQSEGDRAISQKITDSPPSENPPREFSGGGLLELGETEPPADDFEVDIDDLLGSDDILGVVPSAEPDDILSLSGPEFERSEPSSPIAPTESPLELDLESNAEIDLEASLPQIELELKDLEEPSAESGESRFEFPPRTSSGDEIPADSTPEVFEETTEVVEIEEETAVAAAVGIPETAVGGSTPKIKTADDPLWERRSSEASDSDEPLWYLYPLIAIIVLFLGLLAFYYLSNRKSEPVNQPILNENTNSPAPNANVPVPEESIVPPEQTAADYNNQPGESAILDVAPLPRRVKQPPNTVRFKNDPKIQKGELSEKYLGFSIYYPKDWKETKAANKFLDIARRAPDGIPIKQILISRYDSRGTFEADRAIFPELVKNSNADLRNILSNYQVISEGETRFQDNRWRVWEVKFQGVGTDKKLLIWGKRVWIPVQRPGMTSGFIITLFGTSISDDIKNIDDLETDKEIAEILKTFEPEIK